MKKGIRFLFFASGWILLALFLGSAYYFNSVSNTSETSAFTPILWDNHQQVFEGLIECSLTDADLLERKSQLKTQIFSQLRDKQSTSNGFVYYFEEDPEFMNLVWEFVQKEKTCCPFFKFDLSILPFGKGFALQISGAPAAVELLVDFENNDF